MRLFFINPPSNTSEAPAWIEPLGLCYVAGTCKDAGHQVEIRDLINTEIADARRLFAELDEFRPQIVGLTALTENFNNGLELARAVKRRYGCTVVFGGWHVSGEPSTVLEPAIDVVVRGEGEDTVLELLDHFQGKGPALSEIAGIAYKEGSSYRVNPPRTRIRKLDRLPAPLREGLPVERYRVPMLFSVPVTKMRTLSVQASRGCPYKCVFCQTPAVWSSLWTKRTPAAVADEVQGLIETYGINTLGIRDEEFTVRPSWVMELCDEFAARGIPQKLGFGCFARVDDVTPELVAAMKKGGCAYVYMGVEATSPEESEKLQKFFKREEAERAFRLYREAGITTHGSWIIGFPWDTLPGLETAYDWIRTIPMDFLSVLYATPFGSTPLAQYVKENDLMSVDDLNYLNVNEPTIRTPHIPEDVLRTLAAHYRNRFFFHPRFLARTAWQCVKSPMRLRVTTELFFECLGRYRLRKRLEGNRHQTFVIPPELHEPLAIHHYRAPSFPLGAVEAAAAL